MTAAPDIAPPQNFEIRLFDAPVGAEVIGKLKKELSSRGLMPFAADNRIHVVPPCVVTDAEVSQAMKIYDEALTSVEEEGP